MSRSTKLEDLGDEEEEVEVEAIPVKNEKQESRGTTFQDKSSFETVKEYIIENIKEILLVMSVVILSHNKQISSFINSFKITDNEYLLLLLKSLVSGGLFVSGKLVLLR
jgi:hypothetical protein